MMNDDAVTEIWRALERHGIPYVIVGGVAAVLNGEPVSTFDLDIVSVAHLRRCTARV